MTGLTNIGAAWLAVSTVWATMVVLGARGDELILHNGGRIHGRLLEAPEEDAPSYKIQTEHGGQIDIDKKMVKQVIRRQPAESEYDVLLGALPDTAASHWQLAQWCREHDLDERRRHHLMHILRLDPDHGRARHALGYHFVRGKWMTTEEYRLHHGYQRYEGRWRLAQEVQLLEERAERQSTHTSWLKTLHRLRAALKTDRAMAAQYEIAHIRDPEAVEALTEYLAKERQRNVKLLYIEALGEIATEEAFGVLVHTSLNDADVEIFHGCLDRIIEARPRYAVEKYVEMLNSENSVQVQRAAIALGQLGDRSAIRPLIDALVTIHAAPVNSPPALSTTFVRSSDGQGGAGPVGGQILTSGHEAQVTHQVVRHQEVLNALVELSGGVTYGFNRQSWINWHTLELQRKQSAAGTLRGE